MPTSKTYNFTACRYTAGSGALWLTNIRCSDEDLVLSNCTHSGFGNTFECSHLDDIAVSCIVDGK